MERGDTRDGHETEREESRSMKTTWFNGSMHWRSLMDESWLAR
jgi:hypothetical protein